MILIRAATEQGAQVVTAKDIPIGGMTLSQVCYGWPDLEAIIICE
jgi:hypothetical protein